MNSIPLVEIKNINKISVDETRNNIENDDLYTVFLNPRSLRRSLLPSVITCMLYAYIPNSVCVMYYIIYKLYYLHARVQSYTYNNAQRYHT